MGSKQPRSSSTGPFGRLIAWDAAHQKAAWAQDYASPWNGGTLVAAGDLVFQGTADGRLVAYNATSGEKLWDAALGNEGTVYTFAIDGDAKFPEVARYKLGPLLSGVSYDPKDVPDGFGLYLSNCLFCHGVPGVDKGGNIPNLGRRRRDSDQVRLPASSGG